MGTGGANWGANRRFSIRVRIDYVIGKMVQLGGLEPPTSGSTIRRSNQLSYNCIFGWTRHIGPAQRAIERAARIRGKLGAMPEFGKTGDDPKQKARIKKSGL